jgi:hypothetical protein
MPASSTRPMLIFPIPSPYPFVMVKHIENKCLQHSSQALPGNRASIPTSWTLAQSFLQES